MDISTIVNGIRTAKDQGEGGGKGRVFGSFADELHVCVYILYRNMV